ncbi:MAG: site-specific integrase [Opitutales bacterium]|nr:site-specific integrase [Opitutales bacterium]
MAYPIKVKAGSTTANIYKVRKSQTKQGHCFTVSIHYGGRRVTRQFTTIERAKDEARRMVDMVDRGRAATEVHASTADLDELAAARDVAGETGVIAALHEWKRAVTLTGGHLLEAAAAWQSVHPLVQSVTVTEAVERFLAAKTARGVDVKATYRNCLTVFCRDFGSQPLNSIRAGILQRWMEKFSAPGTHNTYRRNIVALFRWCARQGFLSRNGPTEAELTEAMQETEGDIGLFTPADLERIARLMEQDHPNYLAPLALAAWCGMRRAEVHEQLWRDIDLEAGHLNVTGAKRRTVKNRFISLHPTALSWLRASPREGEAIARNLAMDRIRDIARTAGIATPENGFRHAWISARCALTGDPARVASEAGNSPRQIHRHYRRPMPKEVAEAWFAILPSGPLKTA